MKPIESPITALHPVAAVVATFAPAAGDGPIPYMPALDPPLFAACVLIGGEAGLAKPSPSAAAAQVMRQVSRFLPQIVWRTVHMASGVEQPLLPDEVPRTPCIAECNSSIAAYLVALHSQSSSIAE